MLSWGAVLQRLGFGLSFLTTFHTSPSTWWSLKIATTSGPSCCWVQASSKLSRAEHGERLLHHLLNICRAMSSGAHVVLTTCNPKLSLLSSVCIQPMLQTQSIWTHLDFLPTCHGILGSEKSHWTSGGILTEICVSPTGISKKIDGSFSFLATGLFCRCQWVHY